jgi:hypothetical protein
MLESMCGSRVLRAADLDARRIHYRAEAARAGTLQSDGDGCQSNVRSLRVQQPMMRFWIPLLLLAAPQAVAGRLPTLVVLSHARGDGPDFVPRLVLYGDRELMVRRPSSGYERFTLSDAEREDLEKHLDVLDCRECARAYVASKHVDIVIRMHMPAKSYAFMYFSRRGQGTTFLIRDGDLEDIGTGLYEETRRQITGVQADQLRYLLSFSPKRRGEPFRPVGVEVAVWPADDKVESDVCAWPDDWPWIGKGLFYGLRGYMQVADPKAAYRGYRADIDLSEGVQETLSRCRAFRKDGRRWSFRVLPRLPEDQSWRSAGDIPGFPVEE